MSKLSVFLQKRPDMTTDQYRQWWIDHVKISSHIPGLQKYRINFVNRIVPFGVDQGVVEYDGTAELWFGEGGSLKEGFESQIAIKAVEDADSHCCRRVEFVTEEHIILPGPRELKANSVKMVTLLQKKPGITIQEFHNWILEHVKISSRIPNLREYRINLIQKVQGAGYLDADVNFQVSGEQFFNSLKDFEAGYDSLIAQKAVMDAEEHCAVRVRFLTEEHVVVG